MLTFRLKYLFCLVLVIGVTLMWGANTNKTANRLLVAREKARTLPVGLTFDEVPSLLDLPLPDFRGGGYVEIWLWMDCKLYVPVSSRGELYWHADWPAIEAKAREENWDFYRQLIATIVAGLFAGWLVWPTRNKTGPFEK
jgi:hypothetical protein